MTQVLIFFPTSSMAPVVSKSSSSSTGLNETDLCSKLGLYGAANVDKISSRFGWDHKTVIWEIMHMSVAVGRPHTNPFIGYVLDIADQEPSEPHEYKAMLDIDYMNSLSFDAGDHDQNRSNWGLSVYKTSGEFLGLFLHLYDIEGESGTNRRPHHNHSFDDYQGNGIYFKYNFSVLASDGTVVRKIENKTIINIIPGQSWGEEEFLRISDLFDPHSNILDEGEQEKLVIRVDLYLFSELTHAVEHFDGGLKVKGQEESGVVANYSPKSTGESPQVLETLWGSKEFTDVTISCGGRSFSVHKCIISAASPVFATMFTTSMTEAQTNFVEIQDLEPGTLEVLLNYMYVSKILPSWDWGATERVAQLIHACEKYQVKELKDLAFGKLCETLNVTSVGSVLVLTHLYGADPAVREFVYRFIIRNMKFLKYEPNFNELLQKNAPAFAPFLISEAFLKLATSS